MLYEKMNNLLRSQSCTWTDFLLENRLSYKFIDKILTNDIEPEDYAIISNYINKPNEKSQDDTSNAEVLNKFNLMLEILINLTQKGKVFWKKCSNLNCYTISLNNSLLFIEMSFNNRISFRLISDNNVYSYNKRQVILNYLFNLAKIKSVEIVL